MNGVSFRCALHPWQGRGLDVEAIKRGGWHDQGILVISPYDPRLDRLERQLLTQIAERLYGRRTVCHD
jgi:hypothetical protein